MKYILTLLLLSAPLYAMNKPKSFRRVKAWTHEQYKQARKDILADAIAKKQTKRGMRHRKRDEKNK